MIRLEHVSKAFVINKESFVVLKDLNFSVKAGEFIGIMGRSGSGKSTLLNLIGFLDKNFEGNYYFEDKLISEYNDDELSKVRNHNVGFVFQNFGLIENMTVRQNVTVPLMYSGFSTKNSKEKVEEALSKVGLSTFINQSVRLLSGGQRQRVSIARAIVNRPSFIIADEPTGALDSHTSRDIMDLFKELNRQGTTVILVTHDESLKSYCDRVIHLLDGEIVE